MTQENLKAQVIYNPSFGTFLSIKTGKRIGWIHGTRSKRDFAMGKKEKQYRRISIDHNNKKTKFYEHRMAWLYVYGSEPIATMQIDHIDGDGLNNNINNLRLVTKSENNHNSKTIKKGTSNKKGVYKSRGKWVASIKNNGRKYSRRVETELDAILCRVQMEKNIKEFGTIIIPITRYKN